MAGWDVLFPVDGHLWCERYLLTVGRLLGMCVSVLRLRHQELLQQDKHEYWFYPRLVLAPILGRSYPGYQHGRSMTRSRVCLLRTMRRLPDVGRTASESWEVSDAPCRVVSFQKADAKQITKTLLLTYRCMC